MYIFDVSPFFVYQRSLLQPPLSVQENMSRRVLASHVASYQTAVSSQGHTSISPIHFINGADKWVNRLQVPDRPAGIAGVQWDAIPPIPGWC